MDRNSVVRHTALRNFEQARRRAWREQLTARLRDRPSQLLPFEEIRAELKKKNPMYQGIVPVPLSRIVGSVGRYNEFTRRFLPLHDSFRERWVNVETLAATSGWPPLELYKVGEVYFVKDGNHRVAVAQQLEMDTVESHVWAFPDEVEIGLEERLDDVLIRLGERKFLEATELERIKPDNEIRFTTPGRYTELLAQIEELGETLAQIDGYVLPRDEVVAAWYEMIYLPVVQIIQEAGLLDQFPGRTQADLFVWLSLHRNRLSDHYGPYETLYELAERLAEIEREKGLEKIARKVRQLLGQEALPPLSTPEEE